jgi:ammonium transporter, Amt family
VSTHLSGVGGMLGWLLLEKRLSGKATTLGAVTGAVAGLVAVTPAAGFVDSLPALLLGALAGAACLVAVRVKFKIGYDDSLDVVGVHFIGGVIGTLFVGLFASQAVNAAVTHEGLFLGGGLTQLGRQAVGVLAATAWSFGGTYLLARVLNAIRPLRVDPEDEVAGLDFTQHAETAYDLGSAPGVGRLGG